MARISNVLDQGNQKEWKDEMNWSLNYMKDILYSVQFTRGQDYII